MNTLDPSDTIAAIASPPGPAVRGLVRITGPLAFAIALGDFDGPAHLPIKPVRRVGTLRVEGFRQPLDVAIALWPGPRTYTGQMLAEIHATGSPPVLRAILAHYLARGARLAEPGEFTLRAFLSGRIDLTQSEAVLGVIDAQTPAQLDAALRQLAGGLASPIRALRDRLADVLAHLEANLDFAEEPDVDLLQAEALARSLDHAAAEVTELAGRLRGRDREGTRPRVVLVGPPNAGKSRLFNALLEGDRAIVSEVAGTTRDYLEASCECDGVGITLVDTAGLEDARTTIESDAQAASAEQSKLADLLLECRSIDTPGAEIPTSNQPTLRVWTKADLSTPSHPTEDHLTSASTGEGLSELRRAIADTLRARPGESDLPEAPPLGVAKVLSEPAIRWPGPPRRSASDWATSWSPSTSASRSTSSAGSSEPSLPTTSLTGSSAGSVSENK